VADIVKHTYIVWYWDKTLTFRVGQVFKSKASAEQFADSLKHWEFIGIQHKFKIYNDID